MCDRFSVIEEEIRKLTNEDELKYKDFKIIIDSVIENIPGKIRYKIFKLIDKYTGEYENELRYVICLNENNDVIIRNRRHKYISRLSKELDKLFSGNIDKKTAKETDEVINKIFQAHKKRYKKFFNLKTDKEKEKTIGYDKNEQAIQYAEKYDGIFILTTNRNDLGIGEVVESYKNLKEVESLFDDLKNFVDIRPIRHWLEERVRSHVFICILSLLLKRIFEIKYIRGKSITETLEEISKVKLVKYKVKISEREKRSKVFPKITNITPKQQKYFDIVGLKRPMSLEKFI